MSEQFWYGVLFTAISGLALRIAYCEGWRAAKKEICGKDSVAEGGKQ